MSAVKLFRDRPKRPAPSDRYISPTIARAILKLALRDECRQQENAAKLSLIATNAPKALK